MTSSRSPTHSAWDQQQVRAPIIDLSGTRAGKRDNGPSGASMTNLQDPRHHHASMYTKMSELEPNSLGFDLLIKPFRVQRLPSLGVMGAWVAEAIVADETASIKMRITDEQNAILSRGGAFRVSNGNVAMHQGHMRLEVNSWGMIEPVPPGEYYEFVPNVSSNMSAAEYVVVQD